MNARRRMYALGAITLLALIVAAAITAPTLKTVSATALDTFSVDGVTANCDGGGLVSFTGTIPPGGFTLTLMTKAADNVGQFFPAPGVPLLQFTSGNSPLAYQFDLTNFAGPHYRVDSSFNTKSESLYCVGTPSATETPTVLANTATPVSTATEVVGTQSPPPTIVATDTPTATDTETVADTPTATETATVTDTPTATETETATVAPSTTDTHTVTADTQTPVATITPTVSITVVFRTNTPVPTTTSTASNTSTPQAVSTGPAATSTIVNTVLAAIIGPRNGANGASGLPATGQGQDAHHVRYPFAFLALAIAGLTAVGLVGSLRRHVRALSGRYPWE